MSNNNVEVARPRLDHYGDHASIGTSRPKISWEVAAAPAGWRQAAYEVALEIEGQTLSKTRESSDQILVPWCFAPLSSRQRGRLRVRVQGDDGQWSNWSYETAFRTTLLKPDEFVGDMISPVDIGGLEDPAPILSKTFQLDDIPQEAFLYVTAYGIYEASINGHRVGDQLLAPGWTSYHNRLLFQTYDVAPLLRPGNNEIQVTLGNGWWRGNLGRPPRRDLYGERLGLLAQLEGLVNGKEFVVKTNTSWTAVESTIVANDLYNGQRVDLTSRKPRTSSVTVTECSRDILEPQKAPPVRVIDEIDPKSLDVLEDGTLLLDFGVNLVGWVRLKLQKLVPGALIRVKHAEVLEHGKLGTRPLRTAQATDEYLIGEQSELTLEPRFTFHGFRYAEIAGVSQDNIADVKAAFISSDLPQIGTFSCSENKLNQLHDNTLRSARGNFVSIPTDCPQRDERLGWTGDIQVFAPTATYLFDTSAFLASWLRDLALEQKADGSVPYVVPDIHRRDEPAACGWGDAATVVPWVAYQYHGDADLLREQYPSMKAWVAKIEQLAGDERIWKDGFQFGDWLDPTAPPNNPAAVMTPHELVATAYFARSAEIVGKAAQVLGEDKEAASYRELAQEIREAFAEEFLSPKGRLTSESQTAYALALEFALLPTADQRRAAAQRLSRVVRRAGFTIGTGFLGTPLILDALASQARTTEAFRLLLQEDVPSWLYPVSMGATTIWERWDSMLEDGSINPGQMTSFNHYAFGAVSDWLHRRIGGLSLLEPAGRRVRVAPLLGGGITHAKTSHRTPFGEVKVRWQAEGDELNLELRVPVGVSAEVLLPGDSTPDIVQHGTHKWSKKVSPEQLQFPYAPTDREPTVAEAMDDPEVWGKVTSLAAQHTGKAKSKDVAESAYPYLDRPLTAMSRIASNSTIRPGEIGLKQGILDYLSERKNR